MQSRPVKPDGLNWLGIFAGIMGGLLLFAGVAPLTQAGTSSAGPEGLGLLLLVVLGYLLLVQFLPASLVLGAFLLITAVGLLRSKWWAWIFSVSLSITSIVLNLGQIVLFSGYGPFDLITIFVAGLILVYLLGSDVRGFFKSLRGKLLSSQPSLE